MGQRKLRRAPAVIALASLTAMALSPCAEAQEVRLGREFQVNAYTPEKQIAASVAMDADGDFVVSWQTLVLGMFKSGVFARRFSSTGAALANEFEVTTFTPSLAGTPSVGADAAGNFVIAWGSIGQESPGITGSGIFARRFSSAGSPLTGDFQVNTYTPKAQSFPSLAVDFDGDFVVAWQSYQSGSTYGIFGRRFSSSGTALASEFQVNSYTLGHESGRSAPQFFPSTSADADGDFVVAWHSYAHDGSNYGVFARRFSSTGAALATEFQVNTYTPEYQGHPSVGSDADGDFVVAWHSYAQDGSNYGVFARRFSSAGTALASEFRVNTHTTSAERNPSIAVTDNGVFVVTWQSYEDGSSEGVFARRFSSAGLPLATEFQVNTYTTDHQLNPTVAAGAAGDFVVAWESFAQDGASYGIFAQRFTGPKILDVDDDGSVQPLTDGILLLRYLFGFRGATLTNGAVGIGCARCDVASIEAYLAEITALVPLGQEVRLGTEFQVNVFTMNGQSLPVVAAEGGGDFVVAWQSPQAGFTADVFARRFSSTGASLASEFQVNKYTSLDQAFAALASDSDGDFIIVWDSPQDGSDRGVFARRFSSTGVALADEFQVNSYTTSSQARPAAGMGANGAFVVAWESSGQGGSGYGVFGAHFSSAGNPLSGEGAINSYATGDQRDPSVALDADGDFIVAWVSGGQDGSNNGIFARRFSSLGVFLGTEFQVNTYTTSSQYQPSVATDATGDFVVAWSSDQDGSSLGVFARRFSSAGNALGTEFQVNTYTPEGQYRPSVSVNAGGDFVIAWVSEYQDGGGRGVFARRFSSTGAAIAGELQASGYTSGDQGSPSVTQDAQGRFVIAWVDEGGRDGSSNGVFAQRFLDATIAVDIDGNGSADPLTDGLLALRYLFGFRGATLTSGAVGAGCTRCDAAAIESHLAGLT